MGVLFDLFLLAVICVLAFKLRSHRKAIRTLDQALSGRRPLLREELPGLAGHPWETLCDHSNELIAELNRLEQLRSSQLTQLEATLGSLQEAVLVVDSHNYIMLANPALQSIFPRATDILHQRLELVLHSVAFLGYVEDVRRQRAQPQFAIEFIEGAQSVWAEVTGTTIAPLDGSKGPWALFVLHDITKQRKLEGVRKDFVANVSHELRTPLSVIKGYVETLVDNHTEMPAEEQAKFLKTIQRHTDHLHSLLEDLLRLSRLESINPGLVRESVDLAALMKSIVDDYRTRPAAQAHTIECLPAPLLGQVLADPLKLTQVYENLLDNALKYTPPGSRIDLTAIRRKNELELTVSDNGPGIPPQDLPHIFERFYRVEKGRSREKGGTGLGLSIVKHIIQLHGGKVIVESAAGKGTTFRMTLPTTPQT